MCQSRKPLSQLLGEGGETEIGFGVSARPNNAAVDIETNLKNYRIVSVAKAVGFFRK